MYSQLNAVSWAVFAPLFFAQKRLEVPFFSAKTYFIVNGTIRVQRHIRYSD